MKLHRRGFKSIFSLFEGSGCYISCATTLERFSSLQYLLIGFAGWVHRQPLDAIEYLKQDKRVLRESGAYASRMRSVGV